MGAAAINVLASAVGAIVHYFANLPASHAIGWLTLGYFVVKAMPPKFPVTPQEIWTWMRDALQGFVSTKEIPGFHPTQPAPTTPAANQ